MRRSHNGFPTPRAHSRTQVKAASSEPPLRYILLRHDQVPGRLRIHVRGLKSHPDFPVLLRRRLQEEPGLAILSFHRSTGSLLLQFSEKISHSAILQRCDRAVRETILGLAQKDPTETFDPSEALGIPNPIHTRLPNTPIPVPLLWHDQDLTIVKTTLKTSLEDGLSLGEAATRLRQWGPNLIATPPPKSPWRLLLDQVNNLPAKVLLTAAVASSLSGNPVDALFILVVLGMNAAIGAATERRTETLVSSLMSLPPSHVTVVRDGHVSLIDSTALVPGDLALLEPGLVHADMRLTESQRLMVDESTMTGEGDHVEKWAHHNPTPKAALGDRCNMVYAGTVVVSGSGRGVVVATGRQTEVGHIQSLVGTLTPPETPLQENIRLLSEGLVRGSLGLCAGIFCLGMLRGLGLRHMLRTSVSLAIAAIPEGLPSVGTTALAMGVTNLRRKNVFVRTLPAVETLGAVNVICFDKTGTLTLNKMSVTNIYSHRSHYSIENDSVLKEGQLLPRLSPTRSCDQGHYPELTTLGQIAILCNDAEISAYPGCPPSGMAPHREATPTPQPLKGVETSGSPTEQALLRLGLALGLTPHTLRRSFPRVGASLRSATAQFMATWHQTPEKGLFVAVKGSPEQVIDLCTHHLIQDQILPLDPHTHDHLLAENGRLADLALRVLGLAYRYDSPPIPTSSVQAMTEKRPSNLIWVGLVGLKDPPRSGVGRLLESFAQAGVTTNMITGDQEQTALAIGRDIGAFGAQNGAGLRIFSRVSPREKLEIIRRLQEQGMVVAMTGDGVNDSPALRCAHVGIAMGGGASAAINSANIVLGDGQLDTIFEAVREGRRLRQNLKKAIQFLVSTNMSEMFLTAFGVAVRSPHLLNTGQLLWINLMTDVFPALALIFEKEGEDLMTKPPPPSPGMRGAMFSSEDWQRMTLHALALTGTGIACYGFGKSTGATNESADTMAFLALALAQILYPLVLIEPETALAHQTFDLLEPRHKYLTGALVTSLIALGAAQLSPPLRRILEMTPLSWGHEFAALLWGALPAVYLSQNHHDRVSVRRHGFFNHKEDIP